MPDANCMIGRCCDDSIFDWMIDDFGDLFGVSLENRHHLLRIFVEDDRVLVVASGKDFAVIRGIDVDGQNTGNTCGMQRLENEKIIKLDFNYIFQFKFTGFV